MRGRQEAAQHADGGGLTCPVRAQVAKDLATLHVEAHVFHGHEIAELATELAHLDGMLLTHDDTPAACVLAMRSPMRVKNTSSKVGTLRCMLPPT